MHRTTIMLPGDLKLEAQRLAERQGISLGELIRDALRSRLALSCDEVREDSLFQFEVFEDQGSARDGSDHDALLYGEPENEA